jgi:hypothetical protein
VIELSWKPSPKAMVFDHFLPENGQKNPNNLVNPACPVKPFLSLTGV